MSRTGAPLPHEPDNSKGFRVQPRYDRDGVERKNCVGQCTVASLGGAHHLAACPRFLGPTTHRLDKARELEYVARGRGIPRCEHGEVLCTDEHTTKVSAVCGKCQAAVTERRIADREGVVFPNALARRKQDKLTGGDVNYYLIEVPDPKRLEPYTMEAEDIVEVLRMEFAEATVFTSLLRLCQLQRGLGKPGSTEVYEAEKMVYYSQRTLAKAKRRAEADG